MDFEPFRITCTLVTIDHVTEVGSKQITTVATLVTMWLSCVWFEYFTHYYNHMPLPLLRVLYLFAWNYNTFGASSWIQKAYL